MGLAILQQIEETVKAIRALSDARPTVGIVLGSGLGNLSREIVIDKEISYTDIPHFPVSTVEGHHGKLIFGTLNGRPVVTLSGRFHYYEGYSPQQVVFPIRVLKFLGVETLLLSNAAGGMNKAFHIGDLMIINDHISLFTVNPLLGKNEPLLGPRFPAIAELLRRAAAERR